MASVEPVNKFTSHDVSGWNSAFVRWLSVEIFLSLTALLGVFIYEFVAKQKFMSREFESDETKAKEKTHEIGKYEGDDQLPPKAEVKGGVDVDNIELNFEDEIKANKNKNKKEEELGGKKEIPIIKNNVNALDEITSQMLDKPLAPEHDCMIYLFLHIICVGMALHLSDSILLIFLGFIHFLIFVGYLVLHVRIYKFNWFR